MVQDWIVISLILDPAVITRQVDLIAGQGSVTRGHLLYQESIVSKVNCLKIETASPNSL